MNALTTLEEKGLSVLDDGTAIEGKLAWNLAQMIADAETDVRLAKGKFWNRCEHGTRKEICDSFGWNYDTMARYGVFASELVKFKSPDSISFSNWNTARKAGITKEARPELLEKAAEKGWDNKKIKLEGEKISGLHRMKKKQVIYQGDGKGFVNGYGEKVKPAPMGETAGATTGTTAGTFAQRKKTMTGREALAVFGFNGIGFFTKESLGVLYRHYSKINHPDAGGSAEAMARVNEANDILKGSAS